MKLPSLLLAAFSFVLATLATTGCAAPKKRSKVAVPAARIQVEERRLEVHAPVELTTRDDAIVRVVGEVTCTGTLIADDLVLTAHHCVTLRDANNKVIAHDLDPKDMVVEIGGDHLAWAEVGVQAIVSPDCGYASGEGDLAILVLDRKLIGIEYFSVRLDAPPRGPSGPRRGERIRAYGFGRCVLSREGIGRSEREADVVSEVRSRQFVANAAICPGDSGGPALSGSKAGGEEIVGVVSMSVMDAYDTTLGASVFSRVDTWRELFAAARAIADGASPSELPPYRSCTW